MNRFIELTNAEPEYRFIINTDIIEQVVTETQDETSVLLKDLTILRVKESYNDLKSLLQAYRV